MKKLFTHLAIVLILLFGSGMASTAQTTETFESVTAGNASFTSNSVNFSLSGSLATTVASGFGYNSSNKYLDNYNTSTTSCTISSGTVFRVKSLYLYPSVYADGNTNQTSGVNVTFTGKLGGVTKFTYTPPSSDFTAAIWSDATNRGFSLVNFATPGYDNTNIDELNITLGGGAIYCAIDNYTWVAAPATIAPTVTTQAVSSITSATATGNGNVTATGGADITERGIYYSTTNGFADGAGTKVSTTGTWSTTGAFNQPITGLSAGTTYYIKAFATNSYGTSYGAQESFTPSAALGTASNPYLVSTADELNNVRNDLTAYYKQTADINLSGYSPWTPIGTSTTKFTGTYDGDDYKITGLSINAIAVNAGLFGFISGATIKNIGIEGASAISTASSIGILAGTVALNSVVDKCYTTGTCSGTSVVGGLIGSCSASMVTNSYSTANVTSSSASTLSNIGGFIGSIATTTSVIQNCYATGSVTGNKLNTGGFAGLLSSASGTIITNCYSTGFVTSTGGSAFGGFLGSTSGGTASGCFWDTQTSGQNLSAAGTGKTTSEMQTQLTFTSWDFTTIWNRTDTKNNKYPYLEWQVLPFTATVSTTAISTYGVTSATMGGNITTDGGATVTERGVVYSSTDATPTIGETGVTKNANGTGIGTFSKSITGLNGNTTYNVCAYATNSAGTSYGTATNFSTLVAVPTVTGISPINGPTAGTTSVTITGADLTAASAVMFGGTNATSFTVNSATQITATAPAGSAGTVDITVTTAGGTSATSSADQFTYVAEPTITGISTTSGPTAGSTSVVITGTNFLDASAVKFGATNATGYTINSATQITATSPAGAAGTVDITVTTAGGTNATSSADQFTYVVEPTITGISTTSGPTAGSTSVVITGTNFLDASAVKFGTTNATGYTINSATQITATSPAGAAGAVDITVTTAGGTSATSSADQFTYVAAPTITGISTTSGPTAGSTSVVITGTNFLAASAVKFGATNATGYTINSATQITATSPAGAAGTVDITVTTAGGTNATSSADQFTYVVEPTITGISTTSGPTAGSTSVVITGTNLLAASAVKFGATNATGYTINSATQITATSPAGAAGTVDITVTTAGGTSATSSADQFTYVAAPTITGISTTSGPTAGSTSVVITGTNFLDASAVKFGATNATGYTINSATQITATSPAGSAGAIDITVTTTGGTSATSGADQFTYITAPTITGISTTSGPTAGSTSVVITGTNFLDATAVKFGSTNATGFTVNSATQITATAPARSAGVVDITVATAGGTSATSSADQFTYVVAPAVATNAATSISSTGATLAGIINAKNGSTTVTFEYGLTTSYGTIVTADQSPVTGSTATQVSKAITGLAAGVTYHYRVVGVNAGGRTNGLDKSFTTPLFAGNGTPEDPYPIATLADLKWVAEHSDIWNGSFVQTADIDASTTATWNVSKGFSPIGDVTTKFTGSYNGQYHTITGLTINRPSGNDYNIGLFGVTSSATLKNIGLPDCSIIGGYNVGALVGYMGYNSIRTSSISDCYCTGEVSGISYVGGLMGVNQTTGITNSYSTCKVTALTDAAGLLALNINSTIANCFYDKNTSGQSDNIGKGIPKTTAELKEQSTFTGWDFAGETADGTANIWAISSTQNNGYPCFMHQITAPTAPTVTTQAVSTISTTTATGNGNITDLGVPNPTQHGVVWSTSTNPTVLDNKATEGAVSSTGAFPSSMTGLSPNTKYYVRAYATNAAGTNYGSEVFFTTNALTLAVSSSSESFIKNGESKNVSVTSNTTWTASSNQAWLTVSPSTATTGNATLALTAAANAGSSNRTAIVTISAIGVSDQTISVTQLGKTLLTINNPSLTISKDYDGTQTAAVIAGTLTNYVGSDLTISATASYDNKNVGTGKTITVSYSISGADAANYSVPVDYVITNGVITTKAIIVTANATQMKVYGTTYPAYSYTFTPALISGDSFTGALDRVAGENVGLYAINQGTLSAGTNYAISFVSKDFEITTKAITVTANAAQTKVYGATNPAYAYTVAPALVSGDSFTGTLGRTAGENIGFYAISQGTLSAGANYAISFVSKNFEITTKAITVTANAVQTKVYGTTNPTYTYTVTPALVNGDSFTGALDRVAGENVGLYAINQGTLSAGTNYAISFVSKNFEITTKPITVTADAAQTKVYGTTNPTYSYTFAPALVGSDSFTGALGRVAGENIGLYAISQGTLSAGANYAISFVSKNFEITTKQLTINLPTLTTSKTYDSNNTANVTVGTLINVISGDNVNVTATALYNNANVGSEKPITVAYSISGTDAANYIAPVNYVETNGAIQAKQLTISSPTISSIKMYDGNSIAAASSGTLSGVLNSDIVTALISANYNDATVATNKTITVNYTIDGSSASNYLAPNLSLISGAKILAEMDLTENKIDVPAMGGCQGDQLFIAYNIKSGTPTEYQISFSQNALDAGFSNIAYTALASSVGMDTIFTAIPNSIKEGTYTAYLKFRNEIGFESTAFAFDFTINLPKTHIVTKYNNVVLCDNSANNFSAYQWYKNGVAINGATKQFYQDKNGLVGNYYVEVKTKTGASLHTCSQVLNLPATAKTAVEVYPNPAKSSAAFTVRITNIPETDLAEAEMFIFNTSGAQVYNTDNVQILNSVQLPVGDYVGVVYAKYGKKYSFKVSVGY